MLEKYWAGYFLEILAVIMGIIFYVAPVSRNNIFNKSTDFMEIMEDGNVTGEWNLKKALYIELNWLVERWYKEFPRGLGIISI